MDKYLLQFHVMGKETLCPCFKQHYPILVNPIKNYPKLLQEDEPEPEPEPEPIAENNSQSNNPPANPQNSHPPVNIVNNEAENVEIQPHNNNHVNAQANQPPHEEENLSQQNKPENNQPKNDRNNNEVKHDHSQNAMYSSNNPNTDTKFGSSNNNKLPEQNESEGEGLSFLDEDGDSLFSSGFDDSFELNNKPVQNANPSKFRFS